MRHYLAKHIAVCKPGITIDGRRVTELDLQGLAYHYDPEWLLAMLTYDHDDMQEQASRESLDGEQYLGRVMGVVLEEGVLYADFAFTDAAKSIIEQGAVRDFSCSFDRVVLNQDANTGDLTVGNYLFHVAFVPNHKRPAVPGLDRPEDMLKNVTEIELQSVDYNAILKLQNTRLCEARFQEENMKNDKVLLQDGSPPAEGEGTAISGLAKAAADTVPEILKAIGDAVVAGDKPAINAALDELGKALKIMGITEDEAPAEVPTDVVPEEVPAEAEMCNKPPDQYAARLEKLEAELLVTKAIADKKLTPAEAKMILEGGSLTLSSIEHQIKLVQAARGTEVVADGTMTFSADKLTSGDIVSQLSKLNTSAGWQTADKPVIVEWLKRQGLVAEGCEPDDDLISETKRCYSERLKREEMELALRGGK